MKIAVIALAGMNPAGKQVEYPAAVEITIITIISITDPLSHMKRSFPVGCIACTMLLIALFVSPVSGMICTNSNCTPRSHHSFSICRPAIYLSVALALNSSAR